MEQDSQKDDYFQAALRSHRASVWIDIGYAVKVTAGFLGVAGSIGSIIDGTYGNTHRAFETGKIDVGSLIIALGGLAIEKFSRHVQNNADASIDLMFQQ